MTYLSVKERTVRHKDLLDAAEALGKCALICFERGGAENIALGNRMAVEIAPSESGDIGWQIVDVAIMLTRHQAALSPDASIHLKDLLESSLQAWSDREFGRGNVNHPVIATWLYTAAGVVLSRPDLSRRADEHLRRYIHIFSQAGDMSEYNSPTYLGPTLVGLACIGEHAELPSTRLRARLIEERIWLSTMARWHSPSQQLAGPHSRAYADSTLGFGGIVRYLAHAVLTSPVFWDNDMALTYDHNYDAEWAARIAACTFCFPDYLRKIGEGKSFPYTVRSSTDGEDYTVDGKEVYRGGWGELVTYMTERYCLGSSERPYVDGGQTEMCIAYWKRKDPVQEFTDLRALYFRYVANERLPGQTNMYYSWYGGAERPYSPNLLHQDGRQHVLQHDGKAILLSQPVKRENGRLTSLRFDALLPIYSPVDEIWVGSKRVESLPFHGGWQQPVLIRDGSVYLALRPLRPVDLGNADPVLSITEVNHHLIMSIYNLRESELRSFPSFLLDHAHNGMIFEIASSGEYDDFLAFKRHIETAALTENLRLGEIRDVRYQSGGDHLRFLYHPGTQETHAREINGKREVFRGFACPDAVQGSDGKLVLGKITLTSDQGIPAWLAYHEKSGWITASFPTDQATPFRLEMPWGVVECTSFACGRIRLRSQGTLMFELDSLHQRAPLQFSGFSHIDRVRVSGCEIQLKQLPRINGWELT